MVNVRNLLDDASLQDGHAVDPLEVVRAGRRRIRHRGLLCCGALVLVLVVSATAFTLRPWETGETRVLEPVAPAHPTLTPQPDETSAPATAPGTQLSIGETATVPVQHLKAGEVGLTVTAVRRGDRNDILSIPDLSPSLRSRAGRGEFWYVDITITYLSGRIGGYYLDPDVEPALRGGKQIGKWAVTDHAFSPCPSRGLPLRPEAGGKRGRLRDLPDTAGHRRRRTPLGPLRDQLRRRGRGTCDLALGKTVRPAVTSAAGRGVGWVEGVPSTERSAHTGDRSPDPGVPQPEPRTAREPGRKP